MGIIKEFLGIGGYQREAEGAWSWQHILFVSLMLLAMFAISIWLGLRNRKLEFKAKNKAIIWAAILIDAFEILKISVRIYDGGFSEMRTLLPLFLCSIQLITIPLAAFTKGRLQEAALDFVVIFGILGAIFGTVGAAQNYACYPVISIHNVVSAITHCISGFASLYIAISGMQSLKWKNYPICLGILGFFTVAALIANIILDYNYMFLMNHDGTPYVIFWNMVGGNQVIYAIVVVLLFVIYISIYYTVYHWITEKSFPLIKKKAPEKEAEPALK